MVKRLKSFLAPPVYEDEDHNRKARLLNIVLLAIIFLISLLLIARLASSVTELASHTAVTLAAMIVILIGVYVASRHRYLQFSANAVVISTWLVVTLLAWNNAGVKDSAFIAYVVIFLVAGLLSGWRLSVIVIGLSIAAGWFFVYAESAGILPVVEFDPAADIMIDYTVLFGLCGVMIYLLIDGLQQALENARKSNQELTALSQELDQRVQDRTRDLALAAEVGRRISRVQVLDKLLAESVELIRERFALYHVQIYLADDAGQNLNLHASTGMVGRQLLNRGHKLPIRLGSINGRAAFNKKPVLVPDTEANATFRKNPLLPYTRSEMAIPLLMGDQLLGVLDLQSDRPNALSEENLPIYDSLAGQLAVAIDNANLLRQAEEAQADVRRYVRTAVHEGWTDFLDGVARKEKIGVRYNLDTLEAYSGPIMADSEKVLQVPITVAGTEIGVIQLEVEDGEEWTNETRSLVTAVARQVGQQAENMRLLLETDRYRSEAEQAVRRLSGEAWREFMQEKEALTSGFIYEGDQVAPLDETNLPEDAAAVSARQSLKVHHETIGELVVAGGNPDEAQQLLAAVSNQLSRHIENLRLVDQTESALAQTDALYQIGHALNIALNVDEVLQAALGPLFWTGIEEATLMFIDLDNEGEPQTLELLAGWRREGPPSYPVGTKFPIKQFPFTNLFIFDPFDPTMIGDTVVDPRVDDFTREIMMQAGIKAIVVVPLTVGGQWVGIITCSWSEPRRFTKQEEEIFNALINMAAPAVQSQRLFAKTKAQAEKEHLINEINQRIQNTVSVESALQTAAKELGQALQTKTVIRLNVSANKKQDTYTNVEAVSAD